MNFQMARIFEVNQQLKTLVESSEKVSPDPGPWEPASRETGSCSCSNHPVASVSVSAFEHHRHESKFIREFLLLRLERGPFFVSVLDDWQCSVLAVG